MSQHRRQHRRPTELPEPPDERNIVIELGRYNVMAAPRQDTWEDDYQEYLVRRGTFTVRVFTNREEAIDYAKRLANIRNSP